ncbi:UNVERIFIED_ORG: hypothetical protein QFZ59_003231 [Bacillus sp. B2I3]|nr:hypothetical protein [Bacillus sp. B2I3]
MEYLKKPDFLILRNRAFYYWSLLRLYIRIFPYAAINDWIFGNHLCELSCKMGFSDFAFTTIVVMKIH